MSSKQELLKLLKKDLLEKCAINGVTTVDFLFIKY